MNGAQVRDIVVVGASAGGVQTLTELLGYLPRGFPGVLALVLHRSPYYETKLPEVLGRRSPLKVLEPADGDAVACGTVYVAPRDQHMIFAGTQLRLHRGAKEHRTRPAIDPLFRSAALEYGPRVVGVVLTGMGADGVSGLIKIKEAGGFSIAQSPKEALFPVLPTHAIEDDDVDSVLDVEDIGAALVALASGRPLAARVPG